jgi:ABC-type multidrug transport system fused ATPase/permease subunit
VKKLLIYLKDYKKESALAPLFKFLEAFFELLVPLVMAAIIDKGIANLDKAYSVKMCLVMIILGIAGLFFSITAQYFAAKAAVGFSAKLRHVLFSHIQNLSFSEMDTIGSSTMITRMTSDINQVQTGVNIVLRLFLRAPIIVFGSMLMAFTIDIKAALIFVVTIPILLVVVVGIMLLTIPLYKNVQEKLDNVLGITRRNLTGARVIRAFAKEDEEIAYFEQKNQELTNIQRYVGRISALMNPVTYVIINVAMVILIWTGAVRVDMGYITQGAVVALVNYMSQMLVELIKLANVIITVTKTVASGNRIQAVLEIQPSIKAPERTVANESNSNDNTIVSFEHVSLKYKNASEEALTDIHFKVEKGQTIGIIGGTGSGKSSLINMLPRFYDAEKGSVLIDGINVKDYALDHLRAKIGVVMQNAVLFKGTIRENLCLGKEQVTDEQLYYALEIAQAKEFVDSKGGLNALIKQGGKNLSGGQKQRLTIARALVKKPDILILDDSASALDFATDAKLRKAIQQMESKLTVFIVSQRAASIQYADQIIVLDDGSIVGIGTHSALLNSCSVYQEIYYSQFKKEA